MEENSGESGSAGEHSEAFLGMFLLVAVVGIRLFELCEQVQSGLINALDLCPC